MATYTVFSTAADGWIQSTNAVYLTARSGGTFAVDTTSATQAVFGQAEFFGYYVHQSDFDFDTSSIPDAATISSAVLSLYGASDQSTVDFTVEARIFDWGATLTSADYVPGASLAALTLVASFATSAGFSSSAYNVFTDVAFPANVNKTGVTRIVVSSSADRIGTAPGAGVVNQVTAYPSEDAGTTRDPKLVVVDDTIVPPPAIPSRSEMRFVHLRGRR